MTIINIALFGWFEIRWDINSLIIRKSSSTPKIIKSKKLCIICGEPLPPKKQVYCTKSCLKEGARRAARRYYHQHKGR